MLTQTDALKEYELLLTKQLNGTINEEEQIFLDKLLIHMAAEDFSHFCVVMRAERGYRWAWFHKYMMKRMQAKIMPVTQDDKERTRLLLRVGDQHGKSSVIMLFLAWLLGKFPNKQLMYLTYDRDRAKEITPEIVDILIDPTYKRIFPNFMLADELTNLERQAEKSTQRFTNLYITNAGSPKSGKQGKLVLGGLGDVLGLSGDIIICDDLLSGVEAALSEKIRNTKWRTFATGVLSRQQDGAIVIVTGTWWHREDIIGRIQDIYIDNEDKLERGTAKWELIEFNSQKDYRDYPYDHRKFGEYLWPEERMIAYLDQKQTSPLDWQIKHQNTPLDTSGILFKPDSFKEYQILPTELSNMLIIISIDSNYKTLATSDKAGIVVYGIWNCDAYVLECITKHLTLPQLLDESARLTVKYPNYYSILVELRSQGQPFVDICHMHPWNLRRVEGFEPQGKGTKWERANKTLPIYNGGQMHVPNEKMCPGINIFINQHLSFTGEENKTDDYVDCGSQMILHYDHLFRGVALQIPKTITRDQILQGNIKRLMGGKNMMTRSHGGRSR